MFAKSALLLLVVVGCGPSYPDELTGGYSWVSHDVPPPWVGKVATYEEAHIFGEHNNDHGWRTIVRYTMRPDAAESPGCSFTGWIPGHWTLDGGKLVVTTVDANSGSLERHDCPGGALPNTVPRPPHFVRAETPFRLSARSLHLDQTFGEAYPVDLTREN